MRNMLFVVVLACLFPCRAEAFTAKEKKVKTIACFQELRVVSTFTREVITPMPYEDDDSPEFAQKFDFYYATTLHRVSDVLEECTDLQDDPMTKSVLFALRNIGIIWKKPREKRSAPGYHTPHDLVPDPGQ